MTQGEQWAAGPVVDPAAQPPGAQPGGVAAAASTTDVDAHEVVFGLDDETLGPAAAAGPDPVPRPQRNRGGRWAVVLIILLAAALVAWAVVRFGGASASGSDDYPGSGTGTVKVTVDAGETAADIGDTLQKAGVVKTAQSFVDAADANPRATSIQPGTYDLRRHMSAQTALQLLLDPSSRDAAADTVIPEGATSLDVRDRLVRLFGAKDRVRIEKLLADPEQFTLPRNYASGGGHGKLSSLEGFLYPATYTFDTSKGPAFAIQSMISQFTTVDRHTGFAAAADSSKLYTPYEALIIASIAQSEAKFAADMPKVAQVILNRLKLGRPLQFDSTSSYACKLAGVSPCIYADVQSPYNTYRNHGLPPTPIDNPGEDALHAAVHPAAGNWLYFVTDDAAGHLFFTNDEGAFQKAAAKCQAEHWGCG